MRKVALLLSAALALVFTALPASAQILLNEPFAYSDGALTSVSTWSPHSGAGNKIIQVSGGLITLEQSGGSGEDVNQLLAGSTSSSEPLYACFELTVPTGGPIVVSNTYFAHFRSSSFRSRVFIAGPGGGGNFTLGISNSGTSPTLWTNDLSYNTTYKVAMKYDPSAGSSTLWVDPATEGSASVSHSDGGSAQSVDRFAFRQSTGDSFQIIDNLVVGRSFDDVCPAATPTSETSFGRIKAMYR